MLQNKGHVPGTQISKSSDEYVLDLLSTSEEKLLKLLEELDGQDLEDVLTKMEEEEVRDRQLPIRDSGIAQWVEHYEIVG